MASLISSLALIVAISAPESHSRFLRWKVGESVVKVMSSERGGGTGFAVKAASGENYIATNAHVCEGSKNGWVTIKKDKGLKTFKKIVYKDKKHDICLVEGDSRLDNLSIGSDQQRGEYHWVIGHPGLRKLTVSQGENIGISTVKLLDNVDNREQCTGTVMELEFFEQLMFGRDFICIKSFKSYATTAVVYGGNSGSPTVDKYGNVIGIVFAGNKEQERDNHIVPVKELKRVLKLF